MPNKFSYLQPRPDGKALPMTTPGRIIQFLLGGQLRSHETNRKRVGKCAFGDGTLNINELVMSRKRVSDKNNISQLLRDSFFVSQQPPIWEPPSHYSMVPPRLTSGRGQPINCECVTSQHQHQHQHQQMHQNCFLPWSAQHRATMNSKQPLG